MRSKTFSSSTTSKKLSSTILACVLICSNGFMTGFAQAQETKDFAHKSTEKIRRNPFTAPQNIQNSNQNDITLIPKGRLSPDSKANLHIIKLNYARAQDVRKSLQDIFGSNKLAVDVITNAILFQGSEAEALRLAKAINSLDVATQQVTLEAKIIAINKEASKNLGVNWNWDKIPQNEEYQSQNDYNENNSSNDFGGNFKFWRGYSFKFNATLNALLAKGKAKILATPSIITIPGKEASIFIGDHIPVQTERHNSTGSYTTTDYVDAGIKLTYNPIVSQDGRMVTASVHTEVSTPTLVSEMKNYRITSRTADTNVRMLNGETLIIGGLINEEEMKSIQKVPLLSNIPLFGELFKNRSKRKTKTEVIMILTPHITEAGKSPAIYSNGIMENKTII